MPGYSKSQLNGFVADRRYWDRKHPEHKAHLDFTTRAFAETYPDPVAPTKEQEEWAEAEEKRLRDLVFRTAYSNKRDPDHAKTVDAVRRGYDKLNAVLYGTPESEPAETPKPATRDPLDPVMPAPNSFARAASVASPIQGGRAFRAPSQALASSQKEVFPGGAESWRASGSASAPTKWHRGSTVLIADNATPNNPPKVIYPEISAPPGIDGKYIWSPLMVTPSQIEMLWRELEDAKGSFDSFRQGHQHEGTQVTDPTTGELRPPTEKELEIWFEQWQQQIRDFLQDYYEKKDSLFPEEGERVPPLMPIQPENPVG